MGIAYNRGGAGGYAPTAYDVFKIGPAYNSISPASGTWYILTDAGQLLYGYLVNSLDAQLGDEVEYKFSHKAGSYTFCLLTILEYNRGIITVYVDDVSQGTMDLYSMLEVANTVATLPITITSDGEHTLKIEVTGRNSSNYSPYYLVSISAWWLRDAA